MTYEELRTLPLDEIARRCHTVSAYRRVINQLCAIADAASMTNPNGNALALAQQHEVAFRPMGFARDHFVWFVQAIDALCAFGEAVAMVARATLIARVSLGHSIRYETEERALELWAYGPSLCVSEYVESRAPRRLHTLDAPPAELDFADVAAHAVALLIEEANR